MDNLNELIEMYGKKLGASDIGFANLSELDEAVHLGYDRAVSVMIRLSKGILKQIQNAPTITYFSHYRAVNRLLDTITLRLCLKIEEMGYEAFAVPASQSLPESDLGAVFSHKMAATLSGKGWIGKNALFIHEVYGPAVRLGTVLTNAPIQTKPAILESKCGACTRCQKSCPAMAIEGVNWQPGMARNKLLDAYSCSQHMKDAYHHIGRGVVCGLCMVNCPHFLKNM